MRGGAIQHVIPGSMLRIAPEMTAREVKNKE